MNKKICLLTFDEKRSGGVYTRLYTLYNLLSKYYSVNILSVKDFMPSKSFKYKYWPAKMLSIFNTYRSLKFDLEKYDLVISFSLLPSLLSLFNSCKHIFISTGSAFFSKDSSLISRILWTFILQPIIYIFTDAIVPAAPHLVPNLIKITFIQKKIFYITGLIDINRLEDKYRDEVALPKILENLKFISISSAINKQKGILEFIDVYASYVKEKGASSLKLVISGEGPYLNKCILKCKQLGFDVYLDDIHQTIDPQIYFIGFQQNPIKIISKSSIFAMPSFYEGLSNQLLEATFCKVNIISSNCPGNKMIIEATNRFENDYRRATKLILMPVLSSESNKRLWTQALIDMHEDSVRLNSKNMPNSNSVYEFSLQKNGKNWLELIEALIR